MNVIVSNKNKEMLNKLEIETIKTMNGEFSVDKIIESFSNFFFNKMFLDITSIKDYTDTRNIQRLSMNLDMDKVIVLLEDTPECNSQEFLSKLISMGIYNFTKTTEGLLYLYDNPNSYKDVAHIQQLGETTSNVSTTAPAPKVETVVQTTTPKVKEKMIIGFKNITSNAGATSLIYMLKKQLSEHYNVLALELGKKDFFYFKDKDMISIQHNELATALIKYQNYDIILVDMNDNQVESLCTTVLYLIEPSTIKMNKLSFLNKNIFNKLVNEKIILNKSLLTSKDISTFEFETESKVFVTLPPLNDKKDNSEHLLPLLEKLGLFTKTNTNTEQKSNRLSGIFSIFSKN